MVSDSRPAWQKARDSDQTVPQAIYTIFFSGGSLIGGLTGGYIAGREGWQYLFWIPLALFAFTSFAFLLFVPETHFDREGQLSKNRESDDGGLSNAGEQDQARVDTVERLSSATTQPFTFAQSLRIRVHRGNYITALEIFGPSGDVGRHAALQRSAGRPRYHR
jgi:MFS family permease